MDVTNDFAVDKHAQEIAVKGQKFLIRIRTRILCSSYNYEYNVAGYYLGSPINADRGKNALEPEHIG